MSTIDPQQQAPSIWNRPLSSLQANNSMNPNDFQSICQLAMSKFTPTGEGSFLSSMAEISRAKSPQQKSFLKRLPNPSPTVMPAEEEERELKNASPQKLGRFVHFLRCSTCGLESINKTRFDCHLPCCMKTGEQHYVLHTCSACFACSTSRVLMDEHIDLFHYGTPVSTLFHLYNLPGNLPKFNMHVGYWSSLRFSIR